MIWKDAHFKHIIAILSIIGIFGVIIVLEYRGLPAENKDVVNIAIGALIGGLIARIAGSYFPSTGGDKITDKPVDKTTTTIEEKVSSQ